MAAQRVAQPQSALQVQARARPFMVQCRAGKRFSQNIAGEVLSPNLRDSQADAVHSHAFAGDQLRIPGCARNNQAQSAGHRFAANERADLLDQAGEHKEILKQTSNTE
jgi:hypothetical protein